MSNKSVSLLNLSKGVIPILTTLLLTLVMLSTPVLAHNPSDMELEYDFFQQQLNVTITHNVANPEEHYIERVEIRKNDELYLIENYTSQPSTSTVTYTYDVEAVDGDDLKVTAFCSISGSITQEITLVAPSENEIVLIINPKISTIDENIPQNFTVSAYSNSEPLDNIILEIKVKYGAASGYQRTSIGRYNFTYTAPDVTKDLTESIDIKAQKEGFHDADTRLRFTIEDVGDVSGECTPTLDGVITEDEYDFQVTFGDGDFTFHWRVENDTISMAFEANTNGWVAIGIEPTDRMKDADMIFGWVTDTGEITVLDCYSTGEFGPHPPDTQLGGTSDILCYGGRESSTTTTIEFKRLLSTGDTRDKDISLDGEMKIIWAIGSDDDYESKHIKRGYGTIDMSTGEYTEIAPPSFWIYHATMMTVGFTLLACAMIIAKFLKKKKWWLKVHKSLGALGAIFSVSGLLMALYMVSASTGDHFRVPHAYLGAAAIIVVVMTPILGFAQFKIKSKRAKIRIAHRWFGRIALVLMLINIIFGLSLVGII